MKTCHTAFDVKEFLCTKVSTESSLCDGIISQLHSHLSSCYRVTSMSDVCKWSTVNDCRYMLQSLNQVWFQSVFQKSCHSTFCVKITSCYRFLLRYFAICITNDHLGKSILQVCDVACKTENCHDLGSNCDVITVFTRHTVCSSSKTIDHVTKLTVVHVHASLPCDLTWVNVQCIALENVVVDHCCKKVVCSSDCMEVTCEMKVDILHWNNLCVSAACSAALNTEYRSKRWLTKCNHCALSKSLHSISKSYSCSCFSLTSRGRVDCCYKDQFSVFLVALF